MYYWGGYILSSLTNYGISLWKAFFDLLSSYKQIGRYFVGNF